MSSLYDSYYLHDFPDRVIRHLLQHPRNLGELVAAVAPELASGFDFDRREIVPSEFFMEDWRRRESDLLFRVPFRQADDEREVLVCVLIEHQSEADRLMPLRMLLYGLLYWERQWKAWEDSHRAGDSLRLNPILPIVFHTGSRPWTTSRELAALIEGPEQLRKLAPVWPTLLWDLSARSPDDLLRDAGSWLQALAVVRAEEEEREEFERVFCSVIEHLEPLAREDKIRWHDLMWFVLSWAFRRRPSEENQALKQTAAEAHHERQLKQEIEKMSQVNWISAEQEVFQRDEHALHRALRNLLEKRFGSLPHPISERLEAIHDTERLQSLVVQAADIDSLEMLGI